MGIVGAATLILKSGSISLDNAFFVGNILIFINATSYSIYLVLVKTLMTKYNPITVMFYVFSFGLIFVLPFGLNELLEVNTQSFSKLFILKLHLLLFAQHFWLIYSMLLL